MAKIGAELKFYELHVEPNSSMCKTVKVLVIIGQCLAQIFGMKNGLKHFLQVIEEKLRKLGHKLGFLYVASI